MRKILLVDDELLVRTNIKLLLSSFQNELEICGEASDGAEALRLLSSLRPDIVLSDMQMPQMDGLSLCKAIDEHYPNITFIALSNYDDYELVRGVLKNGGSDYLLKHQLNEASLSGMLLHVKLKNEENPEKRNPSTTSSLQSLRESFIKNWLSGVIGTRELVSYNLHALGIHLQTGRICPVILSIDDYFRHSSPQSMQRESTIIFSVLNITNEILDSYHNGILVHMENGNYCLLLTLKDIPSASEANAFISALLNQISAKLKLFLNLSISFIIGDICPDFSALPQAFDKLRNSLHQRFYSKNRSVLHAEELYVKEQPLTGISRTTENQLYTSASRGDLEDTSQILNTCFDHIRTQKLHISNAQMVFVDLISLLLRVIREKNLSLDSVFANSLKPADALSQLNTLEQLQKWFLKSFASLCHEIELQLPADSVYVRKALSIIHKDYHKAINLQIIADEIGISFGYLSTIFKAEMGQSFSEYLNTCRISHAKEMLKGGETDFHKISAACGFQDYSYFFKVFKKIEKQTPSEYIKKVINSYRQ